MSMPLTLRITNEAGLQNGATALSKTFDEQGGTIGRAAGNDWVLPDPTRHISGRHAAIYQQNGLFWLADTSANGVFVNGAQQPVGPDHPVPVNEGDTFEIGDYKIAATLSDAQAAAPGVDPLLQPLPSDVGLAPQAGLASGLDPLAALGGDLPPLDSVPEPAPNLNDPLILLGGAATPAPTPAPVAPTPARHAVPAQPTGPEIIPESLDPLELLGGAAPSPTPGINIDSGAEPDHAPLLESHFDVPAARGPAGGNPAAGIPEDWNEPLLAPQSVVPQTAPQPAEVLVSDRAQAAALAATEMRPAPSSASTHPPPVDTADLAGKTPYSGLDNGKDQALRAFFVGAGLDPDQASVQLNEELAHDLGRVFRQIVGDLRDVLLARSELKSGFQMSMTTIAPRQNNPIKFSAGGVDEALTNLLMRRSPGYLPADEAFSEALNDIKSHHIAVIAGMRASLASLLTRFDPKSLEEHFEAQSGGGSLFASKRAKNWDLYQDYYKEMVREAEENFQKLFGEEFGKAYEEQSSTLSRLHKPTHE